MSDSVVRKVVPARPCALPAIVPLLYRPSIKPAPHGRSGGGTSRPTRELESLRTETLRGGGFVVGGWLLSGWWVDGWVGGGGREGVR
jgi:hypothetical protein